MELHYTEGYQKVHIKIHVTIKNRYAESHRINLIDFVIYESINFRKLDIW